MGFRIDTLKASRAALLGVVLLACLAITASGEPASALLRYERDAVMSGEVWRLLTAHLTHLGWSHLGLNALGMALIAWLCGRLMSAAQWLFSGALSAVVIDTGFLTLNPELDWYVGLSGVLHGLIVTGLLAQRRARPTESHALLALIAAKLAWEQWAGALPGSVWTSGGPIVVDAHLYGAAGGLCAAALLHARRRRR